MLTFSGSNLSGVGQRFGGDQNGWPVPMTFNYILSVPDTKRSIAKTYRIPWKAVQQLLSLVGVIMLKFEASPCDAFLKCDRFAPDKVLRNLQ